MCHTTLLRSELPWVIHVGFPMAVLSTWSPISSGFFLALRCDFSSSIAIRHSELGRGKLSTSSTNKWCLSCSHLHATHFGYFFYFLSDCVSAVPSHSLSPCNFCLWLNLSSDVHEMERTFEDACSEYTQSCWYMHLDSESHYRFTDVIDLYHISHILTYCISLCMHSSITAT